MRVLFTKNHHVPAGERSRRMYKRDHEYEVPDEIGKAAVETKCAKPAPEKRKAEGVRPAEPNRVRGTQQTESLRGQ